MSPPEKGASCSSVSPVTARRLVRTSLDRFPLRLLTDPDAELIRAVGAENQSHWAGTIAAPITYVVGPYGKVRWA